MKNSVLSINQIDGGKYFVFITVRFQYVHE